MAKKEVKSEFPKVFVAENGEELIAIDDVQAAAFAKVLKEKE
ncbi:hypothetical protein [Fictibacillus phosphorivorans]